MSEEIKVSRPSAVRPESGMSADSRTTSEGNSKGPWIILAVVVLVLVVVGVLFRDKLMGKKSDSDASASKGSYQAVFLTNGQVYFGKVTGMENDWLTVKEIYYLQVVQPPLQGQQQPGTEGQAQAQPQISLVKLGNELHGPEDEMHISQNQVLFWENLKADGQVSKAIEDYKKNPANQPVK
jgi:hypothetical protein